MALPAHYLADECGRLYREFMVWGGYPRVAMERDGQRRTAYLSELYNTYVRKDIKDLARIDNMTAFNNLIKHHAGSDPKFLQNTAIGWESNMEFIDCVDVMNKSLPY